jgi:hypothetical protein
MCFAHGDDWKKRPLQASLFDDRNRSLLTHGPRPGDVIERVELQGPGRARSLAAAGVRDFPSWLGRWRGRGDVRLLVAADGSHAVAVRV